MLLICVDTNRSSINMYLISVG